MDSMKRTTVNFWLDAASSIVGLALVFTGLLLAFVIPHGKRGGGGQLELWGLQRHDWGDLHLVLALVMVALVIAHLCLHWSWIACMVGQSLGRGRRFQGRSANVLGMVVLATAGSLLGVTLWLASGSVQGPTRELGRHASPAHMNRTHPNRWGIERSSQDNGRQHAGHGWRHGYRRGKP